MSIISINFLLFIAVVLALYYISPLRFRWIVLLAAGIAFFIATKNYMHLAFASAMNLVAWVAAYFIGEKNTYLSF